VRDWRCKSQDQEQGRTILKEARFSKDCNARRRRRQWCQRLEVKGKFEKLHNENLLNLYCLPYICIEMKSRRMRWEEDVTRMGNMKIPPEFWFENLKRRDYLKDLGIADGRII